MPRIRSFVLPLLIFVVAIGAVHPAASGTDSRTERLRFLMALDGAATGRLEAQASGGDGAAMALLGEAYALSFGGLPQDDAKAAAWLARAVSAGESWAEEEARFFAFRALHGAEIANAGDAMARGVAALKEEATGAVDPELESLAKSGIVDAQVILARQLSTGRGAPKDEAAAARWFAEAAKGGSSEADVELARMFETGRGVPPDPRAALVHFRAAAERGDVGGQLALGAAYAHGADGLSADPVEAMKWLALAGSRGSALAREAFASLAEMSGSAAAGEALGRAADWTQRPDPS